MPNKAPNVLATASARRALLTLGNWPFFIKPACSAMPIIVPVVSNNVTRKNVNIIANKFGENELTTLSCIKVFSKPLGRLKIEAGSTMNPMQKEITAVMIMPRKIAAGTLFTSRTMVIKRPIRVI